jgi:dihydrolipoamide dehydrogenase
MAMDAKYDLIVIGAGPGGYTAAARASQLGMKTACIDERAQPGGVCLNVGCIPSKALLDSSEYYHLARTQFADHGIHTGDLTIDLAAMMARKDQVVAGLTQNVRDMLRGLDVTLINGRAKLAGAHRVSVSPADGQEPFALEAKSIILATGSAPIVVPSLPVDGRQIVDSTGALSFDRVPEHLVIVGGGYIGLELGSVWRRLGAQVTVVEMLEHVAAGLDGQVGRTLDRILRKQGMQIHLHTRVVEARAGADEVAVIIDGKGESQTLTCDRVLVAVGRRPLTANLGLKQVGIDTDAGGRVVVDERYRTRIESVYAIGDLIAGPMLAHKASAEGVAVAEHLAGQETEVNYDAIPAVVYTAPEVAAVGLTEAQARERNIPYCVGSFPFAGAGRARCMGETDGFVKLITHRGSDRLLGAHIIGARAADMIAECVLAMEFGASGEDIARTIHGHPTFAEALQEAALSARACSIYNS